MIIAFILPLEGTVHLGSLDGRFLSISQSGLGLESA
jgi:hypothetical protein